MFEVGATVGLQLGQELHRKSLKIFPKVIPGKVTDRKLMKTPSYRVKCSAGVIMGWLPPTEVCTQCSCDL